MRWSAAALHAAAVREYAVFYADAAHLPGSWKKLLPPKRDAKTDGVVGAAAVSSMLATSVELQHLAAGTNYTLVVAARATTGWGRPAGR